MNQDIAIKVDNITKVYKLYEQNVDRLREALHWRGKKYHREYFALDQISFEIKKGETTGVIGRNGSGKSTLLKIITGVLTPTKGNVTVNGKISALLELGAGFNPNYTGMENIYLQCQLQGYTTSEIDEKLDAILAFAEIGEFVYQPVKIYSSGMFVRLAFAVQACVEPDVFIVDEALAVGDVFFRQKCYQYFERLRANGTSILLVTHNMMDVQQFCQNALLVDQGKALFFGNSSEAVKHYYVLDQKERETMFAASSSPITSLEKVEKKELFWPEPEAFLDLSAVEQIGNGWAHCLGVALCNEKGERCLGFKQGETAHFFSIFELFQDIHVPSFGIVLFNDKGIIVHGKGSLLYNAQVPTQLKKGTIIRVQQYIQLNLAWGEYTFEIGMGTFSQADYQQRNACSWEEVASGALRLCTLPKAHHFQIGRRIPTDSTELSHHGIADLPGGLEIVDIISV